MAMCRNAANKKLKENILNTKPSASLALTCSTKLKKKMYFL